MKQKRFTRIVAAVLVAILLISTVSVLFMSPSDEPQEIRTEVSDVI